MRCVCCGLSVLDTPRTSFARKWALVISYVWLLRDFFACERVACARTRGRVLGNGLQVVRDGVACRRAASTLNPLLCACTCACTHSVAYPALDVLLRVSRGAFFNQEVEQLLCFID